MSWYPEMETAAEQNRLHQKGEAEAKAYSDYINSCPEPVYSDNSQSTYEPEIKKAS